MLPNTARSMIRFLVLLPFLLSPLLAQELKGFRDLVAPDTVQCELLGHVKQISTTVADVDEQGVATVTARSTSTFDQGGFLLEEKSEDLAGDSTTESIVSYYDSDGPPYKRVDTINGVPVKRSLRFLEKERRLIVTTVGTEGDIIHETYLNYDATGREISGTEFGREGIVQESFQIKRDPHGHETEVAYLDEKGKPANTTTNTWNAAGLQTQGRIEFFNDHQIALTEFTYGKMDENGNWLEMISRTKVLEKGKVVSQSQSRTTREIAYY